ncbi:glycosyltransferase family 2 protein [Prochlorothrix hollandica]|uniref:glycosyltransferase family 2 protein n=1 Tax=Prochlorothrix hollandica TaxID=1223 RepID=UPI00333EBE8D
MAELGLAAVGAVVIGRNEGERLVRCLDALVAQLPHPETIVYVDSGSTDGSCDRARDRGITVLELDNQMPFTAARGRNAGWQRLLAQSSPGTIAFVQFIDGDCELDPAWIPQALAHFATDPQVAIVCGRRRERYPQATPYNRLADLEWDTPIGETQACGGDALIRVAALESVGGYDPTLICGEEPEMCIRLRRLGWTIWRLDGEMTLHDAAMTRFGQWWRRSIRGGWAVAEGYARYGQAPEGYMVQQHKSGWLWGAAIPLVILALVPVTFGLSLFLFLAYGLLGWRIYQYRCRQGDRPSHARLYSLFCVISKVPQAIGQGQYWLNHWRGRQATLIEYK